MMSPRVLICGLLCLSPVWSCADAEKSKTPASETPVEIKQPDKYKAVRDANDLRTIEIVTDRDETVAQFFARQQLSLVDNANTDGKFWSIGQIANGEANKNFRFLSVAKRPGVPALPIRRFLSIGKAFVRRG